MDFPAHLLKTEEDRRACLMYLGCVEGVLWAVDFLDGVLSLKYA